MKRHRTARGSVSARPIPDNRRAALPEPEPDDGLDDLLYTLRDNLRRADAFITTGERQLEESWGVEVDESDDDDEEGEARVQRRRMRVEYLVEAGKNAVREALYTTQQIEAEITRRRSA